MAGTDQRADCWKENTWEGCRKKDSGLRGASLRTINSTANGLCKKASSRATYQKTSIVIILRDPNNGRIYRDSCNRGRFPIRGKMIMVSPR